MEVTTSITDAQQAAMTYRCNSSTSAKITQTALTSSSNAVAWDAAAKANAYHVTTENTTFSAPSNAVEGAIISVELAQGGTARTVAWNTVFEFAAVQHQQSQQQQTKQIYLLFDTMAQSGKKLAEYKTWHKHNMEALQRTANRGSISTGYDIDNSCKFEADNDEVFIQEQCSGTNDKTLQ